MLTAAVFYGLLRRSQIFGKPEENIAVNAVVALVAAFMVWAYPILVGVNIEIMLSTFFFQGTIATLVVVIGLLIVSMFMPKGLGESLSEQFKGKGVWIGVLIFGLLIGFGVFFSSGAVQIFFPTGVFGGINEDVILSVAVVIGLFAVLAVIVFLTSKEKK
jgi:uncharacterized membrane protein YjfL (UPF0719 family)